MHALSDGLPIGKPRLADLLDEIAGTFHHYTDLTPPEVAVLLACWDADTHVYKIFRYVGYIHISSLTPRCGKSLLIELIAMFACGNPSITTIPTAATIFRDGQAVQIFDEVDRMREADMDSAGAAMAVLNVGFKRGAVVKRLERNNGGKFENVIFPVYAPRVFAGLEHLSETLADRCFNIQMKRSSKKMPRYNDTLEASKAEKVRLNLEEWAKQHHSEIEAEYNGLPDEVPELAEYDHRFQDIAEPLLVLARLADRERPEGPFLVPQLLKAFKAVSPRREPSSLEQQMACVLTIIGDYFKRSSDEEIFFPTVDLFTHCKEREELRELIRSERALAKIMKQMEQSPCSDGYRRGYRISRAWYEEWQSRYGA